MHWAQLHAPFTFGAFVTEFQNEIVKEYRIDRAGSYASPAMQTFIDVYLHLNTSF
jgi:hypothetical protein